MKNKYIWISCKNKLVFEILPNLFAKYCMKLKLQFQRDVKDLYEII